METAGDVIDYVAKVIRRTLNEEDMAYLWKRMNILYFRIAKKQSWELLRTQVDVETGTDEDGVWLPSNLAGIDKVIRRDSTNGDIEFLERSRAGVEEHDRNYRFTRYCPATVVAFTASDVVLQKDAAAFTSTLMSAETDDYTDMFVRFGEEQGYYQLLTNLTFTPTYNGPTFSKTTVEVRPDNTQKMIFLDPNEDYESGETVTVYYWRTPLPLYDRKQQVLLPSALPLQLELLIDALVWKRRDRTADRYRAELENDAMPEMVAMNPPRSVPFYPKSVVNTAFTCAENYFKDRY